MAEVPATEELVFGEDLRLGLSRMDEVHAEFVHCYNRLAGAVGGDFIAALDVLIAHCEAHFELENAWMEATRFPGCHRAEHDRVLQVMRDIRRRAERGDLALGRQLVREIPEWFRSHATGMDAALAYHLDSIGFDTATGRLPPGWQPPGGEDEVAERPRCN